MSDIRVYFAFRSPYSRLGLHVVQRADLGVEVIPFTGPPEGTPFTDPLSNKLKLAYYQFDVVRMTMRMGLPIAMPNPFEVDFAAANRAAIAAIDAGWGLEFATAVSDARWAEGKNVSELDVLRDCAESIGWSRDAVDAAQEPGAVSDKASEHRALIAQDGVFGVPYAVMGEKKYWGHDRFELLVEDARS
ncbi:MAG: DsbA family protein [Pseudomonadota bacterium]